MGKIKLFLSHSSEDKIIVNAFVNFMYKIGLKTDDIICTSVPTTKIPVGNDIYDYLSSALSEESIYVIFFLSDNYYSSVDCLNEMGAAWVKKADSLNILLPGFDFIDIKGVINKNKIGIKLGNVDSMTKASFNDFKTKLEEMYGITIPFTVWEVARDEFLNVSIENIRYINMSISNSYCITDLENDGCKIITAESSRNVIRALVDFDQTESKLSSIVIFNGLRDFSSYYLNRKNLCFEAYAEKGINCVDVEIKLNYDICMKEEIYLNDNQKTFRIPLIQFADSVDLWKKISEIKFLIHRKYVTAKSVITIKNMRIE